MGNMLRANLFGRSKRGDREEVKMELFDSEGNPFDLDSGPKGPTIFRGKGRATPAATPGATANDLWLNLTNGLLYPLELNPAQPHLNFIWPNTAKVTDT